MLDVSSVIDSIRSGRLLRNFLLNRSFLGNLSLHWSLLRWNLTLLSHHSVQLPPEVSVHSLENLVCYEHVELYYVQKNPLHLHQVLHSEVFLQNIVSKWTIKKCFQRDSHASKEKSTR